MNPIFADAFYWIALLNSRDNWHKAVKQYAWQHRDRLVVTTDGVLDEVLNYASTRGTLMRRKALLLCTRIAKDPRTTVVSYDLTLREQGLSLYGERADKAYSITDCISMVVMKQLNHYALKVHRFHWD